jgi:hypothetical protein
MGAARKKDTMARTGTWDEEHRAHIHQGDGGNCCHVAYKRKETSNIV